MPHPAPTQRPPAVLARTAPTAGPYATRYDPKWGVTTIHRVSTGECIGSTTTGGSRRYADAQLLAGSWRLAEALAAVVRWGSSGQLPDSLLAASQAALEACGWDPEGSHSPVSLSGNRTGHT